VKALVTLVGGLPALKKDGGGSRKRLVYLMYRAKKAS